MFLEKSSQRRFVTGVARLLEYLVLFLLVLSSFQILNSLARGSRMRSVRIAAEIVSVTIRGIGLRSRCSRRGRRARQVHSNFPGNNFLDNNFLASNSRVSRFLASRIRSSRDSNCRGRIFRRDFRGKRRRSDRDCYENSCWF